MGKKTKRKHKHSQVETETEELADESKDLVSKKVSFTDDTVDNSDDAPPKKKIKKRKDNVVIKPGLPTEQELVECERPENKKSVVSKRQQKKEKYNNLKAQQKVESEAVLQQKNLNYLSQWKHNKEGWKFEKLRQNWLQKNMFDDGLIPKEHWKTLLEYFSGAKGQIRKTIIKECMDIVEKYENTSDENSSEDNSVKFKRARDVLQSLEE